MPSDLTYSDIYGTNVTSLSSVTGARTDQTTIVSISARPQITYIRPDIDSVPRAKVGFHTTLNIQGYNFDTSITCYVSAASGVYTNTLSAISAFDLFGSLSGLSAQFPSFSGYQVQKHDYMAQSPNTLHMTLCAAQNTGKINLVVANNAGYCTLQDDLSSTRIVNIAA